MWTAATCHLLQLPHPLLPGSPPRSNLHLPTWLCYLTGSDEVVGEGRVGKNSTSVPLQGIVQCKRHS